MINKEKDLADLKAFANIRRFTGEEKSVVYERKVGVYSLNTQPKTLVDFLFLTYVAGQELN